MRDYTLGDTIDLKFTTRRFSTGVPFALSGGVISAYPDNSTTQLTAGITLTADFDGVTGLNNIRIVATGGNGYAAGVTYALVITTGTVDSVSVVGEVVGEFTLGRSAAFTRLGAPAGASVSADIATIDDFVDTEVAAIKAKTDQLTFTTANQVDAQALSIAANAITAAAIATGAIDADAIADNAIDAGAIAADAITAAKIANGAIDAATFAAGAIDAAAIAADAIGASELAADAVTEIQAGLATSAALATVQADTDNIQTRLPAALTGAGNMKSDALAINGNTTAAAVLAILNGVTVVYQGTVTGAATTTTLIDSGLTQADADWWKGRIIIFTSVLTLQATDITAFDPATDKLTFTAVTNAPTGATYVII